MNLKNTSTTSNCADCKVAWIAAFLLSLLIGLIGFMWRDMSSRLYLVEINQVQIMTELNIKPLRSLVAPYNDESVLTGMLDAKCSTKAPIERY